MTPAAFTTGADGRAVLDLRTAAAARRPDLHDLPELTDAERAMAARTWRARMVNEHISAQFFASLLPQLMRAAAPPAVLAAIPQMVADELRHAEQCAGVVLALGHEPIAPLPAIEALPQHEDADAVEAVLRNMISVCCLSETVAVGVIRAEHAELEGTALGKVLSTILADEIQHARFGWSLLAEFAPRLPDDVRARLSEYLVDALRHVVAYEVPKLPVHLGLSKAVGQAGVCDGALARDIFYATIETVILPRLEDAGLSAQSAWLRARAA